MKSTRKTKSRLLAYVNILASDAGIDKLIDSVSQDLSYIIRLQIQKYKLLFFRCSPELNLDDYNMYGFDLEKSEAKLVLDSRKQVFNLLTDALKHGALPPGDFGHTLKGSIVQCTLIEAGMHSDGVAAGDILWHVMCPGCVLEMQTYVRNKGLERVDIRLKKDSKTVQTLNLKQVGALDLYAYFPQATRHDVWPYHADACAACNVMSGVIKYHKLAASSARKTHPRRGRTWVSAAMGGRGQSFDSMFQQRCTDSFDLDFETTDSAGGLHADSEITRLASGEDKATDSAWECEDLVTSDDDGNADDGQWHSFTINDEDFEGGCNLSDFLIEDQDMHDHVHEFLLGAHEAYECPHTLAAGADFWPRAEAEAGECAQAGAAARACAESGTQAAPQKEAAERATQAVASAALPGALMLPAAAKKRPPIDYVLRPGWVPSGAGAAPAFALRKLRESTHRNTREAPAN